MGNTLTVANLAATQIISPVPSSAENVENQKSQNYIHKTMEGEPPPECPMHKPKVKVRNTY